MVDKYRDICISIQGCGFVFGDFECHTDQKTYSYSLRAASAGAVCCLMEKQKFNTFCKQFSLMGDAVQRTVYDKEMIKMRQLTRVVFNRWYSDLLQENLKVVPDLDGTYKSSKKEEALTLSRQGIYNIANSHQSDEDNRQTNFMTTSPPLPTVRKKVPVHIQQPPAKEIINKIGSNWSKYLLSDYEDQKVKAKQ